MRKVLVVFMIMAALAIVVVAWECSATLLIG
jgi:hypothetical protein